MNPILYVVAGILLVTLVWLVASYNRFVSLRQHLRESWADIDVELKRRHDLIPNLVETVKGYAAHERETLALVIQLRNVAAAPHDSAAAQAKDESAMLRGLSRVLALAEAYPTLKADEQFLALQQELGLTEDRIAAARRFYNGNVRDFARLRETFPTNMIAAMFGIEDAPTYFELASDTERVVPRVQMTQTQPGI
jgi:LemA protein